MKFQYSITIGFPYQGTIYLLPSFELCRYLNTYSIQIRFLIGQVTLKYKPKT